MIKQKCIQFYLIATFYETGKIVHKSITAIKVYHRSDDARYPNRR